MDTVGKALLVAQTAHNAVGQVRKYTGEPYWYHPLEVMMMVQKITNDTDVLAAALLHDVVEDTHLTLAFLEDQFGSRVAELVKYVTEVSTDHDGNRAARKAVDAAHFAKGDCDAQTIKLADIICNVKSIVQHDANFAKVYLHEKQQLVSMLALGDQELARRAAELIDNSLREIYLK